MYASAEPHHPYGPQTSQRARSRATKPKAPAKPVTDAQGGLLSTGDAANVLGVAAQEVRRRCRDGELPCSKNASGAWVVDRAALG